MPSKFSVRTIYDPNNVTTPVIGENSSTSQIAMAPMCLFLSVAASTTVVVEASVDGSNWVTVDTVSTATTKFVDFVPLRNQVRVRRTVGTGNVLAIAQG